jgi:cytochrome b
LSSSKAPIVWSKLTRFLHWGLVLCIAANFINDGDGEKDIHRVVGYTAAAVVGVRFLYGFFGKSTPSAHHRFSQWPLSFKALTDFLRHEVSGQPKDYAGHNPAASWTYLAIWGAVIGLGVTGYMMGLDAFWGEEWLEDLHAAITKVLLALIAVHIVGLAKDAYKFKRKTWNRMISGGY